MSEKIKITEQFGGSLAELLSDKIKVVYTSFNSKAFIEIIESQTNNKTYSQRVLIFAEALNQFLPNDYDKAVRILINILGEENPNETGMFKHFWWILPIAKFVEIYGLDHYESSIKAIQEITKRNTGEYAIRPYIRKFPDKTLIQMKTWATSENFHLRRLASEGLRPKLPWSPQLTTFNDTPQVVFSILELLKEDEIMFVKKSVANHLTDWLKVNYEPTQKLIKQWRKSDNKHTQWIIKRAIRKISID